MTKVDISSQPTKAKDHNKVTNWPEYNAGLTRRDSLTLWIDYEVSNKWYHYESSKRCGQKVYLPACIVLLLMLKVTFIWLFSNWQVLRPLLLSCWLLGYKCRVIHNYMDSFGEGYSCLR